MINVKKYLDENFISFFTSACKVKENGHYNVTGTWEYPSRDKLIYKKEHDEFKIIHNIRVWCSDESLKINIVIDCQKRDEYKIIEAYEHLSRQDNKQWLPSEIIDYISRYKRLIDEKMGWFKPTRNEVESDYFTNKHLCTIDNLLKFIEKHNIPSTAKLFVQRIPDSYYNGNDITGMCCDKNPRTGELKPYPQGFRSKGWAVICKKGEQYYNALEHNEKMDGEYNDKEEYPNLDVSKLNKYTEEELNDTKDQYSPIFSPIYYKDDQNNLYLNLHY